MISILNAYHVFSYKHLYVQKKISIISSTYIVNNDAFLCIFVAVHYSWE